MNTLMDKYKENLLALEELQVEVLKLHYGKGAEIRSPELSKKELDRFSEGLEILLETFIQNPGQKDFNYLKDAPARSAYILFYLMPNVQRWVHMLEVSKYAIKAKEDEPLRIMDFGSGPGSSALGFLVHLGSNCKRKIEIELVDLNTSILKDARYLIENYAKAFNLNVTVNIQKKFGSNKPMDIILMGNVWNESLSSHENARSKQIMTWLSYQKDKIYNDTDILILEPANRRSSRLLMGMRDYFSKNKIEGFQILAPCPSGLNGKECVLNHQKGRPWCHFGFNSFVLPLFERCLPLSGFQNDWLSYSYLILTKKKVEKIVGRVISNVMKIADEAGCYVCHEKGRLTLGPYKIVAVPPSGSAVKKNLMIYESGAEKRARFEEVLKPKDAQEDKMNRKKEEEWKKKKWTTKNKTPEGIAEGQAELKQKAVVVKTKSKPEKNIAKSIAANIAKNIKKKNKEKQVEEPKKVPFHDKFKKKQDKKND